MGFFDRLGAVSGILTALLSFGGFMLIGAGGFAVQPGATLEDVAAVVSQQPPPIVSIGLYLDTLGSLAFVLFAARVWATLRLAEGPPAWLSTTAFGSALLAVGASFGDKAAFHAIFSRAGGEIDPSVALTLYDVAAGSFNLFGAFVGLFVAAASVIVIRTAVLPRWLGWLGAVTGLLSVLGASGPDSPVGFLGFMAFPLVLIWMISTSVLLLLRPLAKQLEAREL